MSYRVMIGLEVHLQLGSKTKLFCGCPNRFGAPPNSLTCPVCQGLPGALPVLNREALRLATLAGLALGCRIAGVSTSPFVTLRKTSSRRPRSMKSSPISHPIQLSSPLKASVQLGA